MADKHDKWADTLSAEHRGWLTGFLAEEDKVDRRMMWRLGSWGVAAVGAVVVAILASQSQVRLRRDQVATSDTFARQSQQIQFVAKETQAEARRLTLAIETLNSDRDRLYARVTSVEQGLDSVTGSIKRQTIPTPTAATTTPAPAPQPPASASVVAPPAATEPKPVAELPSIPSTPVIGPVAIIAPPAETTAAKPAQVAASSTINPPASAPLVAWKSMTAPPDAAAAKLSEPAPTIEAPPAAPETTASVQPAATEPTPTVVEAVATPVARTEFGVDIGGANSVDGLRAIWRGMSKSRALNGLRPIMMVKERPTGLGMQLRLVAGPLSDAAAAAKICAVLTESSRPCETSIFDGQRLAMKAETAPAEVAPAPARPAPRRRAAPKPQERTEQAPPPKPVEEVAPPKPQSSLTSFLGLR
ncbi:hypothetical protein AB7813_03335 [Tardiphaga sp. 20_F10_N6_6]|jgi:hypothetical protein|uniref:hypothetical protein n=1 Tax=unclassified Tardiphaga TaxID=2631404 RepID=UPI003F20B961